MPLELSDDQLVTIAHLTLGRWWPILDACRLRQFLDRAGAAMPDGMLYLIQDDPTQTVLLGLIDSVAKARTAIRGLDVERQPVNFMPASQPPEMLPLGEYLDGCLEAARLLLPKR
jgi:hypothetical protein